MNRIFNENNTVSFDVSFRSFPCHLIVAFDCLIRQGLQLVFFPSFYELAEIYCRIGLASRSRRVYLFVSPCVDNSARLYNFGSESFFLPLPPSLSLFYATDVGRLFDFRTGHVTLSSVYNPKTRERVKKSR